MSAPLAQDVIIIGAGLSGLAAGIRLAHFGHRVTILERHTVWGGLNSFYKKDGHHFDSGLHAVTNYPAAGARGPLAKLCRQLRIPIGDFGLDPQSFSRVTVGGATLDFANGLERITDAIRASFPEEIDGFVRLARDTADYPDATVDRPFASTRRRIGEYLRDPLLVELLLCPLFFYGAATEDDLDWDLFVVLFNSVYREGFGRPRRGIRQILDVLVARLEEAGGVMRRRAGVTALEVEGGRVRGVRLDDGTVLSAEVVLSSAGYVETARLRSDLAPDTLAGSIGRISFTESQHLLDAPAREVGFEPCVLFYARGPRLEWRSPSAAPVDLDSGVVCAPGNYLHPEPLEQHALRITHLASSAAWARLAASDEGYAAAKREWSARSLDAVSALIGRSITPHVRYTESFTPRTVTHYTGHLGGAIYGSPHKQKSGATDLSNLFLCGTDQGLLGIVGAMLSGVAVANARILGAPSR